MDGLNAAIISAGCIIGAPVVGYLADRWGRKAGLGLGAMSIIVGVILEASATKGECATPASLTRTFAYTHVPQSHSSSAVAFSSALLL